MENLIQKVDKQMQALEKILGNNAGLSYMLAQAIFQSTIGLFIKIIPRVPSFQLLYYRSIIQVSINSYMIQHYKLEYYSKNKKIQFMLYLRGFIGLIAVSLYFYALTHIPLAEAQTLLFTSIFWTGVLGFLILKEPYSSLEFSCAIVGLIGILLIVNPSLFFEIDLSTSNDQAISHVQSTSDGITNNDAIVFNQTEGQDYSDYLKLQKSTPNYLLIGRLCAFIAAIGQATIFIVIRSIKEKSSVFVTNYYQNLICTLLSPLGMMYQDIVQISFFELLIIFIMTFFAYLGQIMLTRGIILEKPGKGSVINYLQIVLSLVYSVFILNEDITLYSFLGTICILSTAIALFCKNQNN